MTRFRLQGVKPVLFDSIRRATVGVMLLPALATAGCGDRLPQTYPAEGKVTLSDGSPLKGGSIETLSPPDAKGKQFNSRAEIAPDGSFRLTTFKKGDGALPGEHKVVVFPPDPPGERGASVPSRSVHPRFASYETSDLTLTIEKKPRNALSLTVSSP